MKCEDYREAITADPSESFDGGAAHAAACRACHSYKAELKREDERIADALAIEVPELRLPELPVIERGGAANAVRMASRRSGKLPVPVWIGVAAAVALVAVVAFRSFLPGIAELSLAEEVVAHLDQEPESLRVTTVAVSDRRLGQVLDAGASAMDTGIGLVSYARVCIIDGNTVPHLVIQGRTGPITLILLPDETIDAAIPLEGENVLGVILPVGDGSVAIVGQRQQQMGEINVLGRRLIDSVKWRT